MTKTPKPSKPQKGAEAAEKSVTADSKNQQKIPGAFRLLAASFGFLRRNWKVFLGIVAIYGALNVLFIQGFSAAGNLSEIKSTLDLLFTGGWGQLMGGFTIFTYLLGASGNSSSPTAGVYQVIFAVMASLATIWSLRQLYAGNTVRVRDGFYRGMAPIVQFVLVVIVVVVQLLPLAVGTLLYSTVTANGIAASPVEQLLWALLAIALSSLTLYMVSSSIFAAYIVTLPDMTPMAALRSARQLVRGRRWIVLRKVLFLPVALIVMAAVIIVPLILFVTPLASWAFYAVSMFALPVIHSYMYSLYRSML